MGGIIGEVLQAVRRDGGLRRAAVACSCRFTLDPMLSSVWHDPDAKGARGSGPVARLLRGFERVMRRLEDGYVALLRWGLRHRWLTLARAAVTFAAALAAGTLVGAEFVPQPDNNEMFVQFYTPVGSSLELTQDKARQVEPRCASFRRWCSPTRRSTPARRRARTTRRSSCGSTPKDGRDASRNRSSPCARRLPQIAGVTITTWASARRLRQASRSISACRGPTEAARAPGRARGRRDQADPGVGRPRHQLQGPRKPDRGGRGQPRRSPSDLGLSASRRSAGAAPAAGRRDGRPPGRRRRRELRRAIRLPPEGRSDRRPRAACRSTPDRRRRARRGWCRCGQVASSRRPGARRRSTART